MEQEFKAHFKVDPGYYSKAMQLFKSYLREMC